MSGIFALVIHHTFSLYFSCCEPLGILSPTPWNTVLCSQAREFCVSSQYLIKFGLIYLTSVKYSSEIFIFYWDLSYSLSEMKISSSVLSLLKYVYIFKVQIFSVTHGARIVVYLHQRNLNFKGTLLIMSDYTFLSLCISH